MTVLQREASAHEAKYLDNIILKINYDYKKTKALGNAEYPFIAIAPRSTLARSGST